MFRMMDLTVDRGWETFWLLQESEHLGSSCRIVDVWETDLQSWWRQTPQYLFTDTDIHSIIEKKVKNQGILIFPLTDLANSAFSPSVLETFFPLLSQFWLLHIIKGIRSLSACIWFLWWKIGKRERETDTGVERNPKEEERKGAKEARVRGCRAWGRQVSDLRVGTQNMRFLHSRCGGSWREANRSFKKDFWGSWMRPPSLNVPQGTQ